MQNSIQQIEIIFEELKSKYYQEKLKNEELNIEINMLRQAQLLYVDQIEKMQQELSKMVENDLKKLNFSKNYEELQACLKQTQLELQMQQQNQYEKDLLFKRQIYMLESENQDQRIQIERQKQMITQMEEDVEEMFKKLTKTGYGELVACNQTLLSRIASLEDKLLEQKLFIEKLNQQSSEELSRQVFNYEILVQQYQTLLKENQNLIKSQSCSKNIYQISGQKLNMDMDSLSPNNCQNTTAKKKKY